MILQFTCQESCQKPDLNKSGLGKAWQDQGASKPTVRGSIGQVGELKIA